MFLVRIVFCRCLTWRTAVFFRGKSRSQSIVKQRGLQGLRVHQRSVEPRGLTQPRGLVGKSRNKGFSWFFSLAILMAIRRGPFNIHNSVGGTNASKVVKRICWLKKPGKIIKNTKRPSGLLQVEGQTNLKNIKITLRKNCLGFSSGPVSFQRSLRQATGETNPNNHIIKPGFA